MLRSACSLSLVLLATGFAWAQAPAAPPTPQNWSVVVRPDNTFDFCILKADRPVFNVGMIAWGPNWGWAGSPTSTAPATAEGLNLAGKVTLNQKNKDILQVKLAAKKSADQAVTYRYELTAEKDMDLTMLTTAFSLAGAGKGKAVITFADGKTSDLPLPIQRAPELENVSKVVLQVQDVGDVVLTFDTPVRLQPETGALRVMLASKTFKAGTSVLSMTMIFPGPVSFESTPEQLAKFIKLLPGADWFEFQPQNDSGPSVIGFENWLDQPAGKHGGVRMKGDAFVFEDGAPVKFWGTNMAYGGNCAPDKKQAELAAARFAKYGVNSVRMHKFTYPKNHMGIADNKDVTQIDPKLLDQFDYYADQLRQRGIYYGWSHTFGFIVAEGNKDKLAHYEEIAKNLNGNTYALINFAEDAQDLMIEVVVSLLKHENPYTKKTYAQDPALAYIELQNEDDIFFFTTGGILDKCPLYKQDFQRKFADWLKAKYQTREALEKVWGQALKPAETFEAGNIELQGNPWFMGADGLKQQENNPGARQRLLDNAAFFYHTQNKFYSKFVKAIRDAGYPGPLCGSPWQAAGGLPHYYNLKSDYLVGWIDRHNYFGGGIFGTMLTKPGSGYFSSGLQQVVDRPFGISEWIHEYPDLYCAEGPAIMAVYGMGLQGWDSSYEFQSQAKGKFDEYIGPGFDGKWEVDSPTQIGQYPLLARMIMRGDVQASPVISTRRVSPENLATGKFDFSDDIQQTGDIKQFGGSVPAEALAAGRVVVEFTDQTQASTFPDMAQYKKDGVITSATKQLAWDTNGKGFFTVDTDGTKALVGFSEGKEATLGNVKIAMQCPYASIFLTAGEKGATLKDAKTALVSAVARVSNTGFTFITLDNQRLNNGKKPLLLEPVKARITIAGREIAQVNVLDHDGRKTDKTVPVEAGAFTLDGARDKALYYEVVFK